MSGFIPLIFSAYRGYSGAMKKPWSTGEYVFLFIGLSLVFGWVIWSFVKINARRGGTSWDKGVIPEDFKPTKTNLFELFIAAGTAVIVRDPENSSRKYVWVASYLKKHFPEQYYDFSESYTYSLRYVVRIDSLSAWCNRYLIDELKIQLIEFLTELAMSDGDFIENERQYILLFARKLKIPLHRLKKGIFDALSQVHDRPERNDAHTLVSEKLRCLTVLGLEEGASLQEIKSAYRTLAKLSHPDRFMNEPLQIQQRMKQKFQEVQAAYEALI